MYEKSIKAIKKTLKDDEMFNKIINENPNKVLENEKISIWYPKE